MKNVYGRYMYALEAHFMLLGHRICCVDIEYAVLTLYMLSGHDICCMDMAYVSCHGKHFLDMERVSGYVMILLTEKIKRH